MAPDRVAPMLMLMMMLLMLHQQVARCGSMEARTEKEKEKEGEGERESRQMESKMTYGDGDGEDGCSDDNDLQAHFLVRHCDRVRLNRPVETLSCRSFKVGGCFLSEATSAPSQPTTLAAISALCRCL